MDTKSFATFVALQINWFSEGLRGCRSRRKRKRFLPFIDFLDAPANSISVRELFKNSPRTYQTIFIPVCGPLIQAAYFSRAINIYISTYFRNFRSRSKMNEWRFRAKKKTTLRYDSWILLSLCAVFVIGIRYADSIHTNPSIVMVECECVVELVAPINCLSRCHRFEESRTHCLVPDPRIPV